MNIAAGLFQSALLFVCMACSSAASDEGDPIVGESNLVCVLREPFPESIATTGNVNQNEPGGSNVSRSYRFGFRDFLCNGGGRFIEVRSVNGGLVTEVGEGELPDGAAGRKISHYKVQGRLGKIRLATLDTSLGQHLRYDLQVPYRGMLEFTIEIPNEGHELNGSVGHDILRLAIGPHL